MPEKKSKEKKKSSKIGYIKDNKTFYEYFVKSLNPKIVEKLKDKEKGRMIDGVVVESDDEMDVLELKKELEKFTRK